MTTKTKKKPGAAKKKAASQHIEAAVLAVAVASSKVLVLRTCAPGMTGMHDNSKHFVWPTSGPVECSDWNPTPVCGGGLHGLSWGDGDWGLLRDEIDSVWLVVEVDASDLVKIDESKVKFPRGTVVYCGDKAGAITRVLCGRKAMERAQIAAMKDAVGGQTASGDYSAAASSGDYSVAASSGNYSKAASSGHGSKAASSGHGSAAASSGNYSKAASSGHGSKAASSGHGSAAASSGDYSVAASSGDYSKAASSGSGSTAAASGDYSKAAASGDYSKAASSGSGSTAASSGDGGIGASIGSNGLAAAGANGLVIVTWWDAPAKRHRACVGEVGIDGIEADTWYGVENGKLSPRGKVSA